MPVCSPTRYPGAAILTVSCGEADRVLIDDGWLIISSFNPVSLMGLRKLMPVLRKSVPYNSRMFTLTRQLDWLALLNFEVLHQSQFQVLPWAKQGGGAFGHAFTGIRLSTVDCCA
ncbi:Uncharacterised protein [Kluyvera cryocrescens]|uniref:Uncharacterized protein n=1 Tax=Kluyvera cryocrescens TaxID=580 RepID=A0A485ANA9_KLUCR|nr:Uncharacterised protein [Kluyvera cryocrescens]